MTSSSRASSTRRRPGPGAAPTSIRSRPFTASWEMRQQAPCAVSASASARRTSNDAFSSGARAVQRAVSCSRYGGHIFPADAWLASTDHTYPACREFSLHTHAPEPPLPSILAFEHFRRLSAFLAPVSPSGSSSAAQAGRHLLRPAGRASIRLRAFVSSSGGSSGRTKASTSGSRCCPGCGAARSLFSSSSMRSADTQSRWEASCFAAASVASSIAKPNRAAKR